MSALTEKLRRYGIFNSYDFANARGVVNSNYPLERPAPRCRIYGEHRLVPMIYYSPQQTGRGYKAASWVIAQGKTVTDPDAHWRDYGRKTFTLFGRDDKETQRLAAFAWASEKYGVTEWKREPFGSYMPAEFVDARLKQLKEWLASLADGPSDQLMLTEADFPLEGTGEYRAVPMHDAGRLRKHSRFAVVGPDGALLKIWSGAYAAADSRNDAERRARIAARALR